MQKILSIFLTCILFYQPVWSAHTTYEKLAPSSGFQGQQSVAAEALPNLLKTDFLTFQDLKLPPSIQLIQKSENEYILQNGKKQLQIARRYIQGQEWVVIGNRVYEKRQGVEKISLQEIVEDPLFWMGNAALVYFFGSKFFSVNVNKRSIKTCRIIEWNNTNAEYFGDIANLPTRSIADARKNLREGVPDPFLQSHYQIVIYFGEVLPGYAKPDSRFRVKTLAMIARLSEAKLNEYMFAILGAKNVEVSHVVSIQFRRLFYILKRLSDLYGISMIRSFSDYFLKNPLAPDIVVGRITSMLTQISDEDIQNFKSMEELNSILQRKTGRQLDLEIKKEGDNNVLFINLTTLSEEKRKGSQRPMNVFHRKQPLLAIDKDQVVVQSLTHIAKTSTASIVNQIFQIAQNWDEGWVVSQVIQGVVSNHQVQPVLTSSGRAIEGFLRDKEMGIVRGGFGLGGASIETETWIRDVLTKDDMFSKNVHVLAGDYKAQVDFGEKANDHRELSLFVDSYSYRKLAELMFSNGTISDEDMYIMVNSMDGLLNKADQAIVDISIERVQQEGFFRELGLIDVLQKARTKQGLDESEKLKLIQGVYEYSVLATKHVFLGWIKEQKLDVILIGQIALPNENPVVYRALAEALHEINQDPERSVKVLAYVRQNYFRKWSMVRNGIQIMMPKKDDGIEIFVESETNAEIFETLFGFRPSILYEAVKVLDIDMGLDSDSIQTQLRQPVSEDEKDPFKVSLLAAIESFKEIVERTAREAGLEPPRLEANTDGPKDIIILHPSRMDENKRPDSTLVLAAQIQDFEDKQAFTENRPSRKVRVLFLGQSFSPEQIEKAQGMAGVEARTYQAVQGLAEELGLKNQIYFLGYIKQMEVLAGMTLTDIMSQPSDRETFGRTPMEAMSMGVPVVVSRNYVYPFFEDYQVARRLFGGYRIFTLAQGDMVDGQWQSGPRDASGGMNLRIWQILNNPKEMDEISKLNYLLLRRSMMNIHNLENFLRMWNVMQLHPQSSKVHFLDKAVEAKRAGDSLRVLEAALRSKKLPEPMVHRILSSQDFDQELEHIESIYYLAILDAIRDIRIHTIIGDPIFDLMEKALLKRLPDELAVVNLIEEIARSDAEEPISQLSALMGKMDTPQLLRLIAYTYVLYVQSSSVLIGLAPVIARLNPVYITKFGHLTKFRKILEAILKVASDKLRIEKGISIEKQFGDVINFLITHDHQHDSLEIAA